jgi:hypothetical protein
MLHYVTFPGMHTFSYVVFSTLGFFKVFLTFDSHCLQGIANLKTGQSVYASKNDKNNTFPYILVCRHVYVVQFLCYLTTVFGLRSFQMLSEYTTMNDEYLQLEGGGCSGLFKVGTRGDTKGSQEKPQPGYNVWGSNGCDYEEHNLQDQ